MRIADTVHTTSASLTRTLAFALLALGVLTACATAPGTPGHVRVLAPGFEGHTEVVLEPGTVDTPGSVLVVINLGAHWSSADPDRVLLVAQLPRRVQSIRREDGLQFNIDGELVRLTSPVEQTEFSGRLNSRSRRPFRAPVSLVEQLVANEGTRLRLLVSESQYYEGELNDGANSAYRGLVNFLAEVRRARRAMEDGG
jgi:hypothetical protein